MKNKLTCLWLFICPLLTIKTCKEPNLKPCYNATQIVQTWRNDYIQVQDHGSKEVAESYKLYPVGIFQLKKDGTYTVVSDEVPLEGKWLINPDCSLTLDKNSSNQRTFTVVRLSADSLVISRKDPATLTLYVQHYAKK